ncbi:hypothetical protein [Alkalicoccobacillus plakortidis]|uniref:hypothetical protein n=1 Tax=Alkalicoccobacillus plakortidis TaxID=444060 RepID=UPI0027D9889B|nr:hypothetical protein [Alkalicoccobacillus plakortidis]
MFRKLKQQRLQQKIEQTSREPIYSFEDLLKTCELSSDFEAFKHQKDSSFTIYYYASIIKPEILHDEVLPALENNPHTSLTELKQLIPIENTLLTNSIEKLMDGLMRGGILIKTNHTSDLFLFIQQNMLRIGP